MLRALLLVAGLLLPLAAQAVEVDALRSAYVFSPRAPDPRALWCPFLANAHCPVPSLDVTTTRASTCMSYDGSTWTTQPADTACVGRHGLEAFGTFTNHVTESADPTAWTKLRTPTLSVQPDGGVLLVDDDPAEYEGLTQTTTVTTGEFMVGSAYVRGTADASKIRMLAVNTSISDLTCGASSAAVSAAPSGGACFFVVPNDGVIHRIWARATTAAASANAGVTIYVGSVELGPAETGSFIVYQGQGEKNVTAPGPRHDCDDAACTRAVDVHTVSTAGWPVEAGRIDLQYTAHSATITTDAYLLYGGVGGVRLRRNASGSLAVFRSGTAQNGSVVDWNTTRTISLRWNGPAAAVYIDGAHYMDIAGSVVTGTWDAVAYIGNSSSGSLPANGSIRLLRVSQ